MGVFKSGDVSWKMAKQPTLEEFNILNDLNLIVPESNIIECYGPESRPYRCFCLFKRWYWRVGFKVCKAGFFTFHLPVEIAYCPKEMSVHFFKKSFLIYFSRRAPYIVKKSIFK